jgi:hypothetical protein
MRRAAAGERPIPRIEPRRLTAQQLRGCRGVISYEIRGQWLVVTMAGGEQRKASLASVCQDLGRRLSWHPSTGYTKRRPPPEPEACGG